MQAALRSGHGHIEYAPFFLQIFNLYAVHPGADSLNQLRKINGIKFQSLCPVKRGERNALWADARLPKSRFIKAQRRPVSCQNRGGRLGVVSWYGLQ